MNPRTFAGLVGAALIVIGVLLFLLPVSATVAGVSGTCDSSAPFNGMPQSLLLNNRAYEDWQDECADGASTRQAWGGGLAGVGLAVLIGSTVQAARDESGVDPQQA